MYIRGKKVVYSIHLLDKLYREDHLDTHISQGRTDPLLHLAQGLMGQMQMQAEFPTFGQNLSQRLRRPVIGAKILKLIQKKIERTPFAGLVFPG